MRLFVFLLLAVFLRDPYAVGAQRGSAVLEKIDLKEALRRSSSDNAELRSQRAQVDQAEADGRLALVFSHHGSLTLENNAQLATSPQRLVHAEEMVAALLRHHCVVAWVNGHTHNNTITAHARAEGDAPGGFWEITVSSCIDYPQQQIGRAHV